MSRSGVVSRFKIPVAEAPSRSESHQDDSLAMDIDSPVAPDIDSVQDEEDENSHSAYSLEHGPTMRMEDDDDAMMDDRGWKPYQHVEALSLRPSESYWISHRRAQWGFPLAMEPMASFCKAFCKHHVNRRDPTQSNLFPHYTMMAKLPRFAARYQRLASSLLAAWTYLTSMAVRKSKADSISAAVLTSLMTDFITAVGQEFPIIQDPLKRIELAAQLAYHGIVRRCYYNGLIHSRIKLTDSCIHFLIDVMLLASDAHVDILQTLVPSTLNTATLILQRIEPLAVSDNLPSDIPLAAFDGSKGNLFDSDERLKLYLCAPRRIPLGMMEHPSSAEFHNLPVAFEDYTMPSFTPHTDSGNSAYTSGDCTDFVQNARNKVAHVVGSATQFFRPAGQSLLPLCAISVLDRATRQPGLHNEDRWWSATFVNDTGSFDIEDMGQFFDKFKGMDFRQREHTMAHTRRYDAAVAKNIEKGFAPLLTPNCKAMTTTRFERSDRRASYCPFVGNNHSTANEIRQLLAWQGASISEQDSKTIIEHALNGNQQEGCLAHYNALLKAQGGPTARLRDKKISGPPLFVHMQAMRRDTNAPHQ